MAKALARALAGALVTLSLTVPAIGANTPPPAASAPAAAAATYSGTILSLDSGLPIAGAEVLAYPVLGTEEIRERHAAGEYDIEPLGRATTDGGGRYAIAVPSGGTIVLVASAAGHERARITRRLVSAGDRELGIFDLERGRAVRGKVVDAAGAPVAGAILVAYETPQPLRSGGRRFGPIRDEQPAFPAFARSGADGSFELSGLPLSQVVLQAYAPGMAPARVEDLRTERGLTVKLSPGVGVRGKVVRSDGKSPAAGAWVLAGGDLGWDGTVRAGADGSFELPNVRPGTIDLMAAGGTPLESGAKGAVDLSFEAPSPALSVEVPAKPAPEPKPGEASASAKKKPPVLRLRPGGVMRARVIDAVTRKPVAGARVTILVGGEARPREETTGAGGDAVFPGVPTGQIGSIADADEYFPDKLPDVTIAAREARDVTAALQPAALVEGVVRDLAGKPIAGAVVTVGGPPPAGMTMPIKMSFPIGVDPATSDAQGRFLFEKLPPDEPLTFEAQAPGYITWKLEDLKLQPREKNRSMEILLDPGASITGRLLNGEGEPVAYASVTASRKPEGGSNAFVFRMSQRRGRRGGDIGNFGADSLPPVLSDDKGRFLVGGAKDGVWSLEVKAAGFAPQEVAGLKLEASQGIDAGDITLEPGATIRGHVKNANGEPIPYAQISIAKTFMPLASAVSDGAGFFETEDLKPGETVNLTASADSYGTADLPGLSPPVEEIEVVLPFSSTISGQVLDKTSRQPLTDFRISVSKMKTMGSSGFSMAMLTPGPEKAFQAEDGRFTVDGIDPGKISVRASAAGYRDASMRDLEVEAGGEISDLVILLDRGAVVSGTVRDDAGRPVAGASVTKKEPGTGMAGIRISSGSSDTVTDGDGSFVLDGLDRAPMTLSVKMEGFEPSDVDVDTTQDDVEGLGIVLSRGASLSGVVLRQEDGSPVAGATVTASGAGSGFLGNVAPLTTGPDGSFEFEGLSTGRYTLQAESNGLVPAVQENVVVQAGAQTPAIELRLGGGVTVRGTVSGAKPEEAGSLSVRAYGGAQRGFGVTAPVDASGAFEIKGLSSGSYTLLASTGFIGGRSTSKSIEIPEGVTSMETTIEFPKGSRVEGEVTRGGEPVAGASVLFFRTTSRTTASATTDTSGKYVAEDLDDGEYSVTVMQMQSGLSHTTKTTVDGDETFDIELPLAKIAGLVRDADSGEPLEGAEIEIKRMDPGSDTPGLRIMGAGHTTDASGYYEIAGLQNGHFELTASKDGYGFVTKPVQIIPGADPGEVSFDLSPVEGFTFRALDGVSGLPMRNLSALVMQGEGDPLAAGGSGARVAYRGSLSADSTGLFKLTTLQPGAYTIVVGGQGVATTTLHDVRVPSQQQTVTLPAGGRIEVTCSSLTGNDTAKAALYDEAGRPVHLRTWDEDASFTLRAGAPATLSNVPPGAYTLRATLPGGAATETVAVDSGATAKVSLP